MKSIKVHSENGYSYGAFGKTSTKVTTYTKNSYTYNGENVDLIPGVPDLQYLRARYYDPNMGRFMQQDTLFGEMERPLTQNLYIYCLNNGVNLRDPSGNSSVAELQAQYDKAERAGAGQSVLDGIKSAMERARKAESKPTPKPTTKPPKKPDWGDTSNPYNPVNNPNSVGSILSGADGYWGNNGGSSGGESETDISVPAITEWQRKLAEMYKNGQLGLMERAYFEKNIAPIIRVGLVDHNMYGNEVSKGDYDTLTDIDLIARLILHEDGNIEGQTAIAWTIHNRIVNPNGIGNYNDIESLIKDGYTKFMGQDKNGQNQFWDTKEWLTNNPKWYFGTAKGGSTEKSWANAVFLAATIVETGDNTRLFEDIVGDPFKYSGSKTPSNEFRFYVNSQYSNDPNQIQVGSNYFSNMPH